MPDIYRYEWTGPRTGITYRMDIYAANAAALSSPTVETLNDDVITELKDWGWEDERHPYGLPSAVRGKVTFKSSRVPATLMGWLIDGIQTITATIATGVTVDVVTGTVFDLKVKPPGGSVWSRQGIFVQDVTQVVHPNLGGDSVEITVVDALQHSMKTLTWEHIADGDWVNILAADPTYTPKTGVVEYVWPGSSKWWYVAHVPSTSEIDQEDGSSYWTQKVNDVAGWWNGYVRAVFRVVTRTLAALDIQSAIYACFNGMYTQTHAADAIPDVPMPNSGREPKWILFVTNDNLVDAATRRNYSMHEVLGESYQCFYDALVDIVKGRFKRVTIKTSDLSLADPYPKMLAYDPLHPGIVGTEVDVTELIRGSADPKIRDLLAVNIVASSEFALDDDFEESKPATPPAGRNNDGWTIPVVFDSVPTGTAYEQETNDSFVEDRLHNVVDASFGTTYLALKPRMLGVYYDDTPTDGTLGNAFTFNPALIRAHSWQPFKKHGGTAIPPATQPYILPTADGTDHAAAITAGVLELQLTQGCVSQLASIYASTYYSDMTTTVKCKLPVDAGAEYALAGTDTYLAPFQPHVRTWGIYMSSWASYLAPCPVSYWMVSCAADLKEEIMECSFWGIA